MNKITFSPIGIVHSPFKTPEEGPGPFSKAKGKEGTIEIFPEYAPGLKDLEGFTHINVIFHFHLSRSSSLIAHPPMDDSERGVFSTRSPRRPNGIGLSTVRLLKVKENILFIRNVDMLEGTPVIDIKPYIPYVGEGEVRVGWLEGKAREGKGKEEMKRVG